ncbi:hypothetical protein GOHSU_02_01630 [Gordonia hirsuta DSM 44140 = NBRC 16056]|uniref:Integral membrane bound transporter domain-containing protein n=1 Tax=Gordonia hirsuta DSM 44140 = NBRC 16056 TaxID=1121927 RepID=L7L7K6_9ACTN|nr:FUSC family protein [Gordonia hirsuta]GAC56017.1 hypothetical protein GOHSU_02_01630 [Gordonia hirsuta DSM 44140 = NBRC 16056]
MTSSSTADAPRTKPHRLALPKQTIVYALILLVASALVLGGTRYWIGPNTAQSGYLAILLLLSPARAFPLKWRIGAGVWTVAVAMAGYAAGTAGQLWVVLVGLAAVSLVQGLFGIGHVAAMTRSPVNFVAFSTLAASGAQWGSVVVGSILGVALITLMTVLFPAKDVDTDVAEHRAPAPAVPLDRRMDSGVLVGIGAIIIVLIGELTDYSYSSWALLSYCLIVAVGFDDRFTRAFDRLGGTVLGAAIAVAVSFAPAPWPYVVAGISMLLCIAYLRNNNYAMFVAFLTPAILLTTSTDEPAFSLGLGRIGAVALAAALALVLGWLVLRLEPAERIHSLWSSHARKRV